VPVKLKKGRSGRNLNRSAQIGLRDAKLTFDPGLLMPGKVDERFGIIVPIFLLDNGSCGVVFSGHGVERLAA